MLSLICMYCCQRADGPRDTFEIEADGTVWVYCRACDGWTEHPPE